MLDEEFLKLYESALSQTKPISDKASFSSYMFYNKKLGKEIVATISQDDLNMAVKFFDYRQSFGYPVNIGYARCKIISEKECLLDTLDCETCLDIYKGMGLGRMLLNFTEYFAAKHNADTITLSVASIGSTPYSELCKIYEKLGFTKELFTQNRQINKLMPVNDPEDCEDEKIITKMTKILPQEYIQCLKNQELPYFGVHNIKNVFPAKDLHEIYSLEETYSNRNKTSLNAVNPRIKTKEPTF